MKMHIKWSAHVEEHACNKSRTSCPYSWDARCHQAHGDEAHAEEHTEHAEASHAEESTW